MGNLVTLSDNDPTAAGLLAAVRAGDVDQLRGLLRTTPTWRR